MGVLGVLRVERNGGVKPTETAVCAKGASRAWNHGASSDAASLTRFPLLSTSCARGKKHARAAVVRSRRTAISQTVNRRARLQLGSAARTRLSTRRCLSGRSSIKGVSHAP
jgi:hypothetical protein